MVKKRIALFGKNNAAVDALKILLKKNVDIILIVPNNSDDGFDNWQYSLLKFVKERGLNYKQFQKINNPETLDYLRKLNLDFIFSIQYDKIIGRNIIDLTKYGAINLHFAPLPKYRGVAPIAHALINGEKTFGVTLHYMDPGVDTGDLIKKKIFNIENINSARELYDLASEKATELFSETIDEILELKNSRIPQDNSEALYYPKGSIDFNQKKINFNKDTRSLFNWIRAFIFPPFQYPIFEYENITYEVVYASPDYRKNNFEKPGTLILKDNNLFKFSTHDAYINLLVKK